jgi:hypothetical protein
MFISSSTTLSPITYHLSSNLLTPSLSPLSPVSLTYSESESAEHPVQEDLVCRLRAAFKREALFFWNARSGREVGVLWRPQLSQPSPFSILTSRNRTVDGGSGGSEEGGGSMTRANIGELLSQMLDMSDGLLVQATEKDA